MPETTPAVEILLTVGGLFIVGLAAELLGHRAHLPRVSILLASGVIAGPSGFDLLPPFIMELAPLLTTIALAMVGFLLGQHLTRTQLRGNGNLVLRVSLSVVLVTAVTVSTSLILVGTSLALALLLGGIATATDPAATADVVHETGKDGTFSRTLLGVVAIDDAWSLLLFSVLLAIAQGTSGSGTPVDSLMHGVGDVTIAALIGIVLGVPFAWLTGRVRAREATQAEALGSILLTAGVAVWLDVSYILSTMVLGATVASLAQHHSRPFHAIEGVEWPFLILFFFLAGASLEIESLTAIGWIGAVYILARIVGRVFGARLGIVASDAEPAVRRWLGLALLPQAGVAVGMALLASQRIPELAPTILPVVLGSTVFFELCGPLVTKYVLQRTGP